MLLNLGCGPAPNPDDRHWARADIDSTCGADIVCDARDIPLNPESCDEIFASHILEHFPWQESVEVVRYWTSLLKIGGKLTVYVPDFGRLVHNFLDAPSSQTFLSFHFQTFAGEFGVANSLHRAGFDMRWFEYYLPRLGYYQYQFISRGNPKELGIFAVRGK